jgi:hypothetical protein
MTLKRISPSRVINMNIWMPGIKYLDSVLLQLREGGELELVRFRYGAAVAAG